MTEGVRIGYEQQPPGWCRRCRSSSPPSSSPCPRLREGVSAWRRAAPARARRSGSSSASPRSPSTTRSRRGRGRRRRPHQGRARGSTAWCTAAPRLGGGCSRCRAARPRRASGALLRRRRAHHGGVRAHRDDGGATVNTPDNVRIGTVGRPFLARRCDRRGRRDPAQGRPHLPWLLGQPGGDRRGAGRRRLVRHRRHRWLDDSGFLRITGRKKDLIVTAGGKNVALAVLEDLVRSDRIISQCVVGDAKPFIACLVTLDAEEPRVRRQHGLASTVDAEGRQAVERRSRRPSTTPTKRSRTPRPSRRSASCPATSPSRAES